MSTERDQALHKIWSSVLSDDDVPPHEVVMEGLRRAFIAGAEWERQLNAEDNANAA